MSVDCLPCHCTRDLQGDKPIDLAALKEGKILGYAKASAGDQRQVDILWTMYVLKGGRPVTSHADEYLDLYSNMISNGKYKPTTQTRMKDIIPVCSL